MKNAILLLLLAAAAPLSGGNLYLLAVGDTSDPILGRSASRDLSAMEAFFRRAGENTALSYRPTVLKDRDLSWSRWDAAVSALQPSPSDVLVVYFSTDGQKSAQNAWPDLVLDGRTRNLYSLVEGLKGKKAGLLLVVAETPQREAPEPRTRSSLVPGSPAGIYRGWYDLFLKSRGTVVLAAAESGESALSFPEGGALTVTLLETLNRSIPKAIPLTWAGIIKEVTTLVKEDTGGIQNPMAVQSIQTAPASLAGPPPKLP